MKETKYIYLLSLVWSSFDSDDTEISEELYLSYKRDPKRLTALMIEFDAKRKHDISYKAKMVYVRKYGLKCGVPHLDETLTDPANSLRLIEQAKATIVKKP